jgi:acyl carrier protein phosphodiesterase
MVNVGIHYADGWEHADARYFKHNNKNFCVIHKNKHDKWTFELYEEFTDHAKNKYWCVSDRDISFVLDVIHTMCAHTTANEPLKTNDRNSWEYKLDQTYNNLDAKDALVSLHSALESALKQIENKHYSFNSQVSLAYDKGFEYGIRYALMFAGEVRDLIKRLV